MPHLLPPLCRSLSQVMKKDAWSPPSPVPTLNIAYLPDSSSCPAVWTWTLAPAMLTEALRASHPSSGLTLACKTGPCEMAWYQNFQSLASLTQPLSLFLLCSTSRLRAMAVLGTEGRGSFSFPKAKTEGSPKVTHCHMMLKSAMA